METKYGIISDIHKDPRIAYKAVNVLKSLGVKKLIANGDVGDIQPNLNDSQDYIGTILNALGESQLESRVQIGSHETLGAFLPVISYFEDKFENVKSTLTDQKIEEKDHHVVFLPGSDYLCKGEFKFGNSDLNTGLYVVLTEGVIPYSEHNKKIALARGEFEGIIYYSNINDLRKLVTEPEKTIVICHVPRKFNGNLDNAIDMAYFAENHEGNVISGVTIEEQIRLRYATVTELDVRLIAARGGWSLKIENRGNEDLTKLYDELGINKAVSGHFHESGTRAHDGRINKVKEGEFVDELYWNSGQLDLGQMGILTVKEGKVSYQNIDLNNY